MDYKGLNIELKDLDETKGIVKAYANTYNVEDADGDISLPGSFIKTVDENISRIKVLQDHKQDHKLGVPSEIDTRDQIGLMTVSQFNMKKQLSKDAFTDIQLEHQLGRSSELSIGFKVYERDTKNRKLIKQYKLWEYSFMTTWGANHLSLVQSTKGLEHVPETINLLVKMYNLDYSDARLMKIETLLKSLTSGPDPSTLDVEPIATIDNFINSLKTN